MNIYALIFLFEPDPTPSLKLITGITDITDIGIVMWSLDS